VEHGGRGAGPPGSGPQESGKNRISLPLRIERRGPGIGAVIDIVFAFKVKKRPNY
jgi:hypothetical protein